MTTDLLKTGILEEWLCAPFVQVARPDPKKDDEEEERPKPFPSPDDPPKPPPPPDNPAPGEPTKKTTP